MAEDTVVESEHYSDLDPLHAPRWSVRVKTADQAECLLFKYLVNFHNAHHNRYSFREIVGRHFGRSSGGKHSTSETMEMEIGERKIDLKF
jgi:Rab3 GTPase-activating protein catalytic subunit